jgi:hypothetical protein
MMLLAEVFRLARPLNVRRTLLAAVDAFLEASPSSLSKARQLLARCDKASRPFTVGDIVWGYFIPHLKDSLFCEDPDFLRDLRTVLAAGSPEIHRTYLNCDFARALTADERTWLTTVSDMLDFLGGFPFAENEAALHEYTRRTEAIAQAMRLSPPPKRLEDETIYPTFRSTLEPLS